MALSFPSKPLKKMEMTAIAIIKSAVLAKRHQLRLNDPDIRLQGLMPELSRAEGVGLNVWLGTNELCPVEIEYAEPQCCGD